MSCCDKENKATSAPETNAEQTENKYSIKPNMNQCLCKKKKLGSGSTLKRLVKQSKWQIIDRQAHFVKVSVFWIELSICLLFSLPFLVTKSKFVT
jgi:hypothetical protein